MKKLRCRANGFDEGLALCNSADSRNGGILPSFEIFGGNGNHCCAKITTYNFIILNLVRSLFDKFTIEIAMNFLCFSCFSFSRLFNTCVLYFPLYIVIASRFASHLNIHLLTQSISSLFRTVTIS